jgi:hypothetical protein
MADMTPAVPYVVDGPPAPVGHWRFQSSRIRDGELLAVTGPNLMVSGFPRARAGGLALLGPFDALTYPWYRWSDWKTFPTERFTIDLWARIDATPQESGVAGCLFVGDDGPRGWSLRVEQGDAVFQVATGQGTATVRARALPHDRFVALTARYDTARVSLYVDGRLVDTAPAALGPVSLNGRTPFAVGGWWQGDKTLGFRGIVRSYLLYDRALTDDQIAALAPIRTGRVAPPSPPGEPEGIDFTIAPTIQQVTTNAATIVFETDATTAATVTIDGRSLASKPARLHKVRVNGLKPGTAYPFSVTATRSTAGQASNTVTTNEARFSTLPAPGTPLRFAVVGDTQDHPDVNAQVALGMRGKNPAFGLIVGDLVGAGWEKAQWTGDFFASMRALWADVPLFPVLGNHDRNAWLYYHLFALPPTLHYYAFRAADAEIFVVDTEHEVGPGSEQYVWLERALKRSKARWKIVAHHYPPYSSDLDDYGDDLGDTSARELTPLYDRFGVDIVFSGHIHSYERTHPLRAGKVDPTGTTYLVVGGGGGDLEEFLPQPPAFSAVRRSAHHYGIVDIGPTALTFSAYTLDGDRFDTITLHKPK